jgi:hypothetical protein
MTWQNCWHHGDYINLFAAVLSCVTTIISMYFAYRIGRSDSTKRDVGRLRELIVMGLGESIVYRASHTPSLNDERVNKEIQSFYEVKISISKMMAIEYVRLTNESIDLMNNLDELLMLNKQKNFNAVDDGIKNIVSKLIGRHNNC